MAVAKSISGRVTAPAITACRMTGSPRLVPLLDLGTMALTGIFPEAGVHVPAAPVELILVSTAALCSFDTAAVLLSCMERTMVIGLG